jgi:uncharacterized protein (TIGR01777 family)
MSKIILIAGGTGLIGRALEKEFVKKGHTVRILSRHPVKPNHYFWDPKKNEIDLASIEDVEVIINLCGASIGSEKWTTERKKVLYDSRVLTTEFLYKHSHNSPTLKQYITASGITCYGFDNDEKVHFENDPFGKDYLGRLVQDWEQSADEFSEHFIVSKIRTAVVLDSDSPAFKTILRPIKSGFGSAIGKGNQWFPWIHITDLTRLYSHVLEHQLHGPINAVANVPSNKEFLKTAAKIMNRPFWSINVPEFLLRYLFGEMADIILKGQNVSNEKVKGNGFTFTFENIDKALNNLLVDA